MNGRTEMGGAGDRRTSRLSRSNYKSLLRLNLEA